MMLRLFSDIVIRSWSKELIVKTRRQLSFGNYGPLRPMEGLLLCFSSDIGHQQEQHYLTDFKR